MKKSLMSGLVLAASLAFAGAAHADIKIGVAGPLTGPNAAFGAQLQKGAEQAVADINKAGGVLGQQFSVELGDDVSDAKQGVSVANKFVGDGVKFVIGHFNSSVSIPASEVYAENDILQITPASTNPTFTERQPLEHVPHLRPRRPAGRRRRQVHRRKPEGQAGRRHPRQDDLRPGPRRRDQEGAQRQRRHGSDV